MDISRIIKSEIDALLRQGKTQNQLAKEFGISQAQLSYFINGKRGFSVDTVGRILDRLGYHIDKYENF